MAEGVHYVRAFEDALAAKGLRRFERYPWINPRTGRREGRVLGQPVVERWRVGRDFWADYIVPVVDDPTLVITYGGAPIVVDDTLPTQAVAMDLADRD